MSWVTSAPVSPSSRVRQAGFDPYNSTTGTPLSTWYSTCPLSLASSEGGSPEREPVDLADTTSATLATARPIISRRGVHVHDDIQPAILDGDPLLVQQLVTNLIDNAVQHNIRGGDVQVRGGDVQVATRTSSGHAVLSVSNSGQVIPPTEVDRLFQPFQRLGPRPARRDGGHGLGLSIVRAIATAHGATVEARALPEGGLAVNVAFLPRHPVPAPLLAASSLAPVPSPPSLRS